MFRLHIEYYKQDTDILSLFIEIKSFQKGYYIDLNGLSMVNIKIPTTGVLVLCVLGLLPTPGAIYGSITLESPQVSLVFWNAFIFFALFLTFICAVSFLFQTAFQRLFRASGCIPILYLNKTIKCSLFNQRSLLGPNFNYGSNLCHFRF